MNERCSIRGFGRRLTLLLGLIALLLGVLAPPRAALAHALDEYGPATYITVAPTQIMVELNLTPGVLVAPQVLMELDPDGDQQIGAADGEAYVDAVLSNVALHVDGQPLALHVTNIEMPPHLNIQTGYGTIRIFAAVTLGDGMTGTHQIAYKNNFAPTGAVYQVNAFVDKGAGITLGKQHRNSIQQSMTVDYAIGGAALATPAPMARQPPPQPPRRLVRQAWRRRRELRSKRSSCWPTCLRRHSHRGCCCWDWHWPRCLADCTR